MAVMRFLGLGLLMGMLLGGCGAGTTAVEADQVREPPVRSSTTGPEATGEDVEAAEPEAEPEPEPLPACEARDARQCAADGQCVREPQTGACRAPTHECELVAPRDPEGFAVGPGDRCQGQRRDCGFDPRTGLCAPFTALSECPATAEEATAATVLCDHSDQPELDCRYRGMHCSCHRPRYCGGPAPRPDQQHPPATWVCLPPFDDRGCPTEGVREGTRCRVNASVQCMVGCDTLYTCEQGRWRIRALPPRP
ncbi:MAG: hypothetical protein CMN30_17810 [Sandaracinus sp.]|nr:hypothetical protein [Sandaracinus sp.]|tara:strand:- start:1196 stop:1951 length:756 start_codon:yes stop_codon:yes gene_type:complete